MAKKKKVTRNVPEKANVTSSEENEEDNDNMEQIPEEMDNNNKKAKRHRSTNLQDQDKSEMMEMMRDMRNTISNQQELIQNLQKDGTRANISIAENDAQKALPTSYAGPSYLLDRSRLPSDIWTASVAATKTLSALINSGVNIPHDHQLLKSCRSQAARCARCAAAAINGLQAAAHIEQGNSGKMADVLRTCANNCN
jgi:hypothetical protein